MNSSADKVIVFDLAFVSIVLPLEADLIVFDIEQAIVGDRDAVSVAAHVIEHLLRSGERSLGIDDPLASFQRGPSSEQTRGVPEAIPGR